jgi:hypothetical protein
MRRSSWSLAGSLLLVAALAGCRDGAVPPTAAPLAPPPGSAPAPVSLAPAGHPTLDLTGGSPDSASIDFYVGPNGGIFRTGNPAVVFPSGSVCDPAVSSYGPGTWNDPCTPIQSTLKVHAEVRQKDGRIWVDFTPSLRFVPTTNPAKWVWLVMYTPRAVDAGGDLSAFNILWTKSIGGTVVDEAPSDSTLRTYVDTFSGISLRRIQHFSGYTSDAGRTCTTDCTTPP